MKKGFYVVIAGLVTLCSCSTQYYSHRSVNIERKDLIVTPVVTELSVDLNRKIESVSSKRKTVDAAKDEAYYKALTDNKIDVLVDPIYSVNSTSKFLFFGGKTTAKVVGFAGKYTGTKKVLDAANEYNKIDSTTVNNFKKLVIAGTDTKQPSFFDKPSDPKKTNLISLIVAALLIIKLL